MDQLRQLCVFALAFFLTTSGTYAADCITSFDASCFSQPTTDQEVEENYQEREQELQEFEKAAQELEALEVEEEYLQYQEETRERRHQEQEETRERRHQEQVQAQEDIAGAIRSIPAPETTIVIRP